MVQANRNLAILVAAQALLFINNATVLAVNGVVGKALVVKGGLNPGLATLPITAWVIGGALSAYPAALCMRRWGRRLGYILGALTGAVGAFLAIGGVMRGSFVVLCLASAVIGIYNAFGLQYRFAAAESVPPAQRARALGLVMTAGVVGGFVGPELSRLGADLLTAPYAGVYLVLGLCMIGAVLLLHQLELAPPVRAAGVARNSPWPALLAEPKFLIAVVLAALAHGTMSLLMTATTLTMTSVCGHPYGVAARVLGVHMVAMFLPSFMTGMLVQRFGERRVVLLGCGFFLAASAVALAGQQVVHFTGALVLLGVGWNLVFVSSTVLLTRSVASPHSAYAQGANEAMVFVTMAAASLLSGLLVERQGWALLAQLSALTTVLMALLAWRIKH